LGANTLASVAFINTDIAASVAMVTWLAISWIRDKKPSFVGALTGAVAGLATITPAAGFVPPWAAVVIGLLSGYVCYYAVQLRIRLGWDDALDVWGVHGVGGMMGSILVGVFALGSINGVNGLIYGDAHQFIIQVAGVVIASAYAFIVTLLILKVVNIFVPVRVSEAEEREGLDVSIHKEVAYHI
ncbi:MAG: ammonium transporter, partial [Eubacteriales bacterium]|nr:ammonium transporter [Eubacteriales bacterium]